MKLATVLDQADESEVQALDVGEVRELALKFKVLNSGVSAQPEEEASPDQLAALRLKLDMDVPPYADFAVFRPHGARLGRTLRFTARIWVPEDGAYVNKEIPGPSTFEEWRRGWRVYRYALLVLNVVSAPRLERYYERVYALHRSHGSLGNHNLWWLIAMAEARMRNERFEHIRRELEEDHLRLQACQRAHDSMYNPRRPWDSVFFVAANDEEYWNQNVKEPALLFLTSLKARGEITDDGHHTAGINSSAPTVGTLSLQAPDARGRGAPRAPPQPGKNAARNAAKRAAKAKAAAAAASAAAQAGHQPQPKPKAKGGGKKGEKGGFNNGLPRDQQECFRHTKDPGGCSEPCPAGRAHPACPRCGGHHAWRKPCPT